MGWKTMIDEEYEELLERFINEFNKLPEIDRRILWLDLWNDYEERDMLLNQLGKTKKASINRYIGKLKDRLRESLGYKTKNNNKIYAVNTSGKKYEFESVKEAEEKTGVSIYMIYYGIKTGKKIYGEWKFHK